MIVAIKVGGSVLCPPGGPDESFGRRLADALLKLSRKHRLVVVVGGGSLARSMISKARPKAASEDELHALGIEASRKNAAFLARLLAGKAEGGIPGDAEEVKEAFAGVGIVVAGGFRPGQTTDAVTVQSALAVGADLVVIGTDVKGVYDRDPKKHPDARLIPRMTPRELLGMSGGGSVEPGKNTIVDRVAASLIEKSGIRAVVLDVSDTENLIDAVEGRSFEGTVIG